MIAQIRNALGQHGRLAVPIESLGDDDDLYQAGLSSHASVNLMLALEEAFEVEFPDRLLKRATFQTVHNIRAALEEMGASASA